MNTKRPALEFIMYKETEYVKHQPHMTKGRCPLLFAFKRAENAFDNAIKHKYYREEARDCFYTVLRYWTQASLNLSETNMLTFIDNSLSTYEISYRSHSVIIRGSRASVHFVIGNMGIYKHNVLNVKRTERQANKSIECYKEMGYITANV